MRILAIALVVAIVGCSGGTPKAMKPAPTFDSVTLKTVKWPELEAAIAAHKGQIVVVDCWAEY